MDPTFMFPNPSPLPDAVKQIPRFPKYHRRSPWWNSRIHTTKPNRPTIFTQRKKIRRETKLGQSKLAYVKNFVQFWPISQKNFQKAYVRFPFRGRLQKAEMVLLGRHKKFKTTSQFSGFRLSNINPRSPTAHDPTTTLSLTLLSAESSTPLSRWPP